MGFLVPPGARAEPARVHDVGAHRGRQEQVGRRHQGRTELYQITLFLISDQRLGSLAKINDLFKAKIKIIGRDLDLLQGRDFDLIQF